MKTTFKVNIEIDSKQIVDLFIIACEGGSNYWVKEIVPFVYEGSMCDAMLSGFYLTEKELDESGEGISHHVTPTDIERALQLMQAKFPRYFADMVNENTDAETGDVFLQLCVFGNGYG